MLAGTNTFGADAATDRIKEGIAAAVRRRGSKVRL
jgi:hypothetical protein